jgi:putative peptidoglycan lipid II flippase
VRIVYGVSNFPWEATVKTSYALAFFSISIFSQSAVYLLTRAFYALKDTRTPVIISSITIVINILLSLLFIEVYHFGVWSIAFSYSITSIIDALAMLVLLSKKLGGFELKSIIVPFTKMSYAGVLMGISLYIPLKLLDQSVFDTTRTINLLALTAIAGTLGMATYLFFTKWFKVGEIQMFYKLFRKLNITEIKEQKDISSDATAEVQV